MNPVIRTSALTKNFGTTRALDSLDLEVRQGEVLGFLGPNGAGKSTTLRILLGQLRKSGGDAEVLADRIWFSGWVLGLTMMMGTALMSIMTISRHTRVEEQTGRAELVRAEVVGITAVTSQLSAYSRVGSGIAGMILAVAFIIRGLCDMSAVRVADSAGFPGSLPWAGHR